MAGFPAGNTSKPIKFKCVQLHVIQWNTSSCLLGRCYHIHIFLCFAFTDISSSRELHGGDRMVSASDWISTTQRHWMLQAEEQSSSQWKFRLKLKSMMCWFYPTTTQIDAHILMVDASSIHVIKNYMYGHDAKAARNGTKIGVQLQTRQKGLQNNWLPEFKLQ